MAQAVTVAVPANKITKPEVNAVSKKLPCRSDHFASRNTKKLIDKLSKFLNSD